VEELLDELKITLVVFVDDLDRCLPKTAIATLESIRLLLFLKRSAFVVAADNDFIEGAVRIHFAQSGITKDIATNYFDKLIQVPLMVPRLGINEVKAYLALLLMQHACAQKQFDKVRFDNALEAIPDRLRSSWKGEAITTEFLEATVGPSNTEMVKLMKLVEGLAPLLSQSSDVAGNPRLMKRFLNTVYLRKALAEPQHINLDIPALAKWHLVERCDSDLANALAGMVTSKQDGRVELLRQAEEAAAKGTQLPDLFTKAQFAAGWLLLEPKLGEQDLRPLLHLSRDTVVRDFGVDELNADGRVLRDAFLVARTGNQALTAAIHKAGPAQAQFAMERAWQLSTGKRTWKKNEDMVVLLEPCRAFKELGAKASALLSQAPAKDVGPGIIPKLYAEEWARPIVENWLADTNSSQLTKNAIRGEKGKLK
jgi:predicted KAP-like P-loop ATPase